MGVDRGGAGRRLAPGRQDEKVGAVSARLIESRRIPNVYIFMAGDYTRLRKRSLQSELKE
jgi:hypothetical protein